MARKMAEGVRSSWRFGYDHALYRDEEGVWRLQDGASSSDGARFHDLRRLAAGLMIHSSGNVAAAGLMLGHSRKSSLTADLYAYLPPEMAEGMVEGVERLLAEVGAARRRRGK